MVLIAKGTATIAGAMGLEEEIGAAVVVKALAEALAIGVAAVEAEADVGVFILGAAIGREMGVEVVTVVEVTLLAATGVLAVEDLS